MLVVLLKHTWYNSCLLCVICQAAVCYMYCNCSTGLWILLDLFVCNNFQVFSLDKKYVLSVVSIMQTFVWACSSIPIPALWYSVTVTFYITY